MSARLTSLWTAGVLVLGACRPGDVLITLPFATDSRAAVIVLRPLSPQGPTHAVAVARDDLRPLRHDLAAGDDLEIFALIHARSLEALGLVPGDIELESMPPTSEQALDVAFSEAASGWYDRVRDGERQGWAERVPIDDAVRKLHRHVKTSAERCAQDYAVEKVPLAEADRRFDVYPLGPDSALLLGSRALDRTATGAVGRLTRDDITYLHPDQLVAPTPECVSHAPGFVSSVWTGPSAELWITARPCGARNYALYRGTFGEPLTPLDPPPPSGSLGPIAGMVEGEGTLLFGASADRHLWRYGRGEWTDLIALPEPPAALVATGTLAVVGVMGERTLFQYDSGALTTVTTVNPVQALAATRFGPIAVELDIVGLASVVWRFTGEAGWKVMDGYPVTSPVFALGPFGDGFVYSGLNGAINVYDPLIGFCPPVAGRLGIYDVQSVAALGTSIAAAGFDASGAAALVIATPK